MPVPNLRNVLLFGFESRLSLRIQRLLSQQDPEATFTCVPASVAASRPVPAGPWDAVIASPGTPGSAGLASLRALRARAPDLPIVFVAPRDQRAATEGPGAPAACGFVTSERLGGLRRILARSGPQPAVLPQQAEQPDEPQILRERLARVAARLPGVIYCFRLAPDGTYSFPYASPMLKNIFGVTFGNLERDGSPVFDTIHPDDLPRIQASIAASARDLTPWDNEFRIRHPQRHEIWLEGHSVPQRDADGGTSWHGFVADITDRKHKEATLRAQAQQIRDKEALLRALLDAIPDLVFFKDPHSVYLGCNKAFEIYAGTSEQDLVGKTDLELTTRDVAEAYRRKDREILSSGRPQRIEEWIPFKRGGGGQFETLKTPVRGQDGQVLGLLGISRDITERQQAQRALEESRERYRFLFTGMMEGCAYCRFIEEPGQPPDFLYVDVNPSFANLTGLQDVRGRRVSEVLPDLHRTNPELFEVYGRVARTGVPERLETHVPALQQWFSLSVSSPERGHFLAVFEIITARKQAELALRQSEQRFRTTLDAMLEGCQIIGSDDFYLYVNDSAARYGRKTREELVGRKLGDVYPGIEHTALYQEIRNCLTDRLPRQMQSPFTFANGDVRWFDFSMHPVPEGVFILSIDVTDRRQSEEILRQSEERFRQLFDRVTRLAVQGYGPDGTVRLWNQASEKLYGFTAEEAIGRNLLDLIIPPAARDEVRAAIRQMVDSGSGHAAAEVTLMRKDGSLVPVYSNHTVVDVHGRGKELYCIDIDLTELKQAEAGLRLQSAALAAAANSIVITDREGRIEWVNPAFAQMTGYSAEEAIGRNPRDLIKSGQHDASFYAGLWATIGAGQVWRGEIVNRRKDGTCYVEEMTITPVRDEQGEIARFIAIKQEITERKHLEEQLLRTQRLESVGRLASGIAHDLNNILAPMLLGPPVLRETLTDPAALEILDAIETSAERGASVIKQLLTFGRGLEARREPIQLRSLTRDMMNIMAETFPRNIVTRLVMPPELDLIHGDETQIHQVLMNLCVNARDALPQGGQLTLALAPVDVDEAMVRANAGAQPGRHVVLTVSDTGTGIRPELLDKIFDPFFTTKAVGEGTGLGLSTVLGIVRSHHGFIQVESQPERGTTFRIYLPACPPAAELPRQTADEPLPHGRQETILVVDDEESIRHTARRMLEQHGYHVLEARHGAEALSVLAAHPGQVQLALTDLMMPVMDGPALIAALHLQYPAIKIVTMSGLLDGAPPAEPAAPDAQAWLSKPFSATQLLTKLHSVLAT